MAKADAVVAQTRDGRKTAEPAKPVAQSFFDVFEIGG
jgi:hypothetical protein